MRACARIIIANSAPISVNILIRGRKMAEKVAALHTFNFIGEDYTLGNLIQSKIISMMELKLLPGVEFCGFRRTTLMMNGIEIMIRTVKTREETKLMVSQTIQSILRDVDSLDASFCGR